ncbi:MAG: hypothetical protein ACKO0M_14240 [Cyanobium sp.]
MKQALLLAAVVSLLPSAVSAQHSPSMGSTPPAEAGAAAAPPMFATQAEAEAAAPRFHCSGSHRMGDQWMPCAQHGGGHGGSMAPAPMAMPTSR